jgi:hypothetical protein
LDALQKFGAPVACLRWPDVVPLHRAPKVIRFSVRIDGFWYFFLPFDRSVDVAFGDVFFLVMVYRSVSLGD